MERFAVLIFLGGFAVLLALTVLGGRASTHLFHQGENRYFDHCDVCDRRYARLPGVARTACPQGHAISAVVAEPHQHSLAGTVVIALCAGFAIAVIVLALTGHLPSF